MFDVMLPHVSVLSLQWITVSRSLSGHLSDTERKGTVQTHRQNQKLSLVTRTKEGGDKVTNRQYSVTSTKGKLKS